MNILYVIQSVTPDEKEIYEALTELGHNVTTTLDRDLSSTGLGFDFLLFHHSPLLNKIHRVPLPKFFWYFDLMEVPFEPAMSVHRTGQVSGSVKICTHGFCTDGDIAKKWPDKVTRLTQGAHGLGRESANQKYDILFAGTTNNREDFVSKIKERFPNQLKIIQGRRRVFGKEYAQKIAKSQIVVAPDSPIKLNYWSNRVYVVCGFGGFLLHPYIEELSHQYEDRKEIVYYHSREELYELIDYYLKHPEERELIRDNAVERTRKEHTYKHRCQKLISIVESCLQGVPQ